MEVLAMFQFTNCIYYIYITLIEHRNEIPSIKLLKYINEYIKICNQNYTEHAARKHKYRFSSFHTTWQLFVSVR